MLPTSSQSTVTVSYQYQYENRQTVTKGEAPPVSVKTPDTVDSPDEASAPSRAERFDVDAVVDTVYQFAANRVAEAQADGATEAEIEALWTQAREGVEQGFAQAREQLDALGVLDEPLSLKISSAYGQLMDKMQPEPEFDDMDDIDDLAEEVILDEVVGEDDSDTAPPVNTPPVNQAPDDGSDDDDAPPVSQPGTGNPVAGSEVRSWQSQTQRSEERFEVGRNESQGPDRAISLYQYERETFSLDLTTAEGDTIRIRSVNEQVSNADDWRFGSLSATRWSTDQSSGYELYIDGDLNDQERADLDALLAEVNELAAEFYDGDYETAFDMAQAISIDGTTLRSMDLNMQESTQKSANVYAEMAGQTTRLPAGLEALRDYSEKLLAAQERWQARFDAAQGLFDALNNHPMNQGQLAQKAMAMLS